MAVEGPLTDQAGESLTEERLRLEREALAVERERLATARAHAEEAARLAASSGRHPLLLVVAVMLLVALAFASGLLVGISTTEGRQERLRENRLARALEQIGGISGAMPTNVPSATAANSTSNNTHRNVQVVVIQ